VPPEIGRIRLQRVHAFGAEFEIEADGQEGELRPAT
jgi:hypothetical protein